MKLSYLIYGTLVIVLAAVTISLARQEPQNKPSESSDEVSETASQTDEIDGQTGSGGQTGDSTDPASGPPSVITFPSHLGAVEFYHEEHSEDYEIDCVECHHELGAVARDIPHEKYFEDFWVDCRTCHRESGEASLEAQACSNCHDKPLSHPMAEAVSSKSTIHKTCWQCHEVETGVTASESCETCHSGERLPF